MLPRHSKKYRLTFIVKVRVFMTYLKQQGITELMMCKKLDIKPELLNNKLTYELSYRIIHTYGKEYRRYLDKQ